MTQENFALLSSRRGSAPEARARSIETQLAALRDPSVDKLIEERLLMAPALLQGAALEDALAAQREGFAKLWAVAG